MSNEAEDTTDKQLGEAAADYAADAAPDVEFASSTRYGLFGTNRYFSVGRYRRPLLALKK